MKSRENFMKGEIKIIKKYWNIGLIIMYHILLRWMMKKD